MEKKHNLYKISLEEIKLKNGSDELKTIHLAVTNHDDILDIIKRQKERNLFGNEQDAAEFALGLKLFTEVMLRNRNHPVFEDLKPVFGNFMQKVKSYKND